jgi:hypothetical protein
VTLRFEGGKPKKTSYLAPGFQKKAGNLKGVLSRKTCKISHPKQTGYFPRKNEKHCKARPGKEKQTSIFY